MYADFDGFGIILTTENGVETTNTIYLEPEVLIALNRYMENLEKTIEKQSTIGNDNKEGTK